MRRTSVQVPIILGFGAMLLILTAVVLANIYQIHAFNAQIRTIVLERNKKTDLAALMKELHDERFIALTRGASLDDPFARDDEISRFRELARRFIKARDQFMGLPLDDSEKAIWESVRTEVRRIEAEAEVVFEYQQANRPDLAKLLVDTRLAQAHKRMMAGWSELIEVQNEKNLDALSQSDRMDAELARLSVVLGGIAVLIGVSVALFAIRTSRRLELELLNEKERAQVTLEAISDAVIRINPQGEICYLNRAAESLIEDQLPPGGCKPISILQLLDKTERTPLIEPMLADLENNLRTALPDNACLVSPDGMEYDVEGIGAPLRMGSDKTLGAVIVLRDVTEARNTLRRQNSGSGVDPLTGLTDPLQLEDRLASALLGKRASDQPMGFLLIRLDNAAEIRLSAGNAALETLLHRLGQSLRLHIRDTDIVSRLDDTRFGILLPACPESKAAEIAGKIRAALSKHRLEWEKQQLPARAWVGAVHIPPFSGSVEDCMRAAGR